MEKALKWMNKADNITSQRYCNKRSVIVQIDIELIKRKYPYLANLAYDLTKPSNRDYFLKNDRQKKYACAYSEVVFECCIPSEAVSICWQKFPTNNIIEPHLTNPLFGNPSVQNNQAVSSVGYPEYSNWLECGEIYQSIPPTISSETTPTSVRVTPSLTPQPANPSSQSKHAVQSTESPRNSKSFGYGKIYQSIPSTISSETTPTSARVTPSLTPQPANPSSQSKQAVQSTESPRNSKSFGYGKIYQSIPSTISSETTPTSARVTPSLTPQPANPSSQSKHAVQSTESPRNSKSFGYGGIYQSIPSTVSSETTPTSARVAPSLTPQPANPSSQSKHAVQSTESPRNSKSFGYGGIYQSIPSTISSETTPTSARVTPSLTPQPANPSSQSKQAVQSTESPRNSKSFGYGGIYHSIPSTISSETTPTSARVTPSLTPQPANPSSQSKHAVQSTESPRNSKSFGYGGIYQSIPPTISSETTPTSARVTPSLTPQPANPSSQSKHAVQSTESPRNSKSFGYGGIYQSIPSTISSETTPTSARVTPSLTPQPANPSSQSKHAVQSTESPRNSKSFGYGGIYQSIPPTISSETTPTSARVTPSLTPQPANPSSQSKHAVQSTESPRNSKSFGYGGIYQSIPSTISSETTPTSARVTPSLTPQPANPSSQSKQAVQSTESPRNSKSFGYGKIYQSIPSTISSETTPTSARVTPSLTPQPANPSSQSKQAVQSTESPRNSKSFGYGKIYQSIPSTISSETTPTSARVAPSLTPQPANPSSQSKQAVQSTESPRNSKSFGYGKIYQSIPSTISSETTPTSARVTPSLTPQPANPSSQSKQAVQSTESPRNSKSFGYGKIYQSIPSTISSETTPTSARVTPSLTPQPANPSSQSKQAVQSTESPRNSKSFGYGKIYQSIPSTISSETTPTSARVTPSLTPQPANPSSQSKQAVQSTESPRNSKSFGYGKIYQSIPSTISSETTPTSARVTPSLTPQPANPSSQSKQAVHNFDFI